MEYSDKILKVRSELSLTQAEMAHKLGVSGSAIGLLERGESKSPSAALLSALASKLDVSLDWFLNDKGPMLRSEAVDQNISSYDLAKNPGRIDLVIGNPPYTNARRIPVDSLNLTVLPYVPIEARAGLAEFYADDVNKYPWENAETMAVIDVPDTAEYKEAIVVAINGDSMDPTIKNGSKVVVTPVQRGNWQYLNPGVYCIIFRDNFVVKRVKDNTLLENGFLRLHSDNPAGGSFQIKGEDIHAVWRVRWAAYTPIE